MPRPTELNEDKIQQAEQFAALLLPIETIADLLGVSARTVWRWKERGKGELQEGQSEGLHARFVAALNKGYAKTEGHILTAMMACLEAGQWGAGKFILTTHPHYRRRWKPEEASLQEALQIVAEALKQGDQDTAQRLKEIALEVANAPSV